MAATETPPSTSLELTPEPTLNPSGGATSSTEVTPVISPSVGTTVICSPEAPPGAVDPDARLRTGSAVPTNSPPGSTTGAEAPSVPAQRNCGPAPVVTGTGLNTSTAAGAIEQTFPGAAEDSRENATQELVNEVPESHTQTRQLLGEKVELPASLGGFFGEDPWTLPDTDETVKLDVTREGNLKSSELVGTGLREYAGGEPDTRTVFQQLPGRSVRIYKIIDRHAGDPAVPTELAFTFERGCSGGFLGFGGTKCSDEQCPSFFSRDGCTKAWSLSPDYSYLGSRGIALIDPNVSSDVIDEGVPRGFLTAPAARDAEGKPVFIEWGVADDDMVYMRVYDGVGGIKYPVVVDPQYFVGRWLVKGALIAARVPGAYPLELIGCGARIVVDWPSTVGGIWYRRVWHAALACMVEL